jgi:hypothetical protein
MNLHLDEYVKRRQEEVDHVENDPRQKT